MMYSYRNQKTYKQREKTTFSHFIIRYSLFIIHFILIIFVLCAAVQAELPPNFPGPGRTHAAVAVQGGEQKITGTYVFGGVGTDGKPLLDAWVYEPNTDSWRALPPLPHPVDEAVPTGCQTIQLKNSASPETPVLAYHTVPNAYCELPAEPPVHPTFGWVNWTVLLVYLGTLIPFGFYFKKRANASSEDYFRGGGRIPWWVNGFSIYATMLSSITFIAAPTMVYLGDWRYFPNSVSLLLVTWIAVTFFVPRFCGLNLTCAYEYLENRFNLFVRLFASSAFIIFMIARSAVVMYIPALVLNTVAGLDIYLSICLIGGITLIYSTMGGMEAVAWADFLQAVILIGSALTVLVFLAVGSGGFCAATQIAYDAGKMRLWDFGWDWSQPVFWVTVLGCIQHLSSYTSDQTVIQRYITMKKASDTVRSMWLSGVMGVLGLVIFYFIGTFLFSFYHVNPQAFDPNLYQNDAVFPTFMVREMPVGVVGLMVAAVFAATISTISGNFNSSAAAFVSDFFCRFSRYTKETPAALIASLWGTVVTGILAIGFSLFLATMPDIKSLFDTFLTTIGILTGGLCGLFIIGFFMPRVGVTGAVCGLVASYLVNGALIFDRFIGLNLAHKPHALLYSVISLGVCVAVAGLTGLVFQRSRI